MKHRLSLIRRSFPLIAFLILACASGFANTPGKHQVTLKWTGSTSTGITGYNVYRGSASGVCNGTPTPYATNVPGLQYVDSVGLTDGQTVFYNVSAVGTGGAESACDGEIQVQIPVLPNPPTALGATVQ